MQEIIPPEDEKDVDHYPDSYWLGIAEDEILKLLDDLPPEPRRTTSKRPNKAKGKGAGTP